MTIPYANVLVSAARWVTNAPTELRNLANDVVDVFRAVRRQWQRNQQFRSTLIRELLDGLATAALRGPRATVLWAVSMVSNLIAVIVHVLEQDNLEFSTAY